MIFFRKLFFLFGKRGEKGFFGFFQALFWPFLISGKFGFQKQNTFFFFFAGGPPEKTLKNGDLWVAKFIPAKSRFRWGNKKKAFRFEGFWAKKIFTNRVSYVGEGGFGGSGAPKLVKTGGTKKNKK